MTDNTEQASKMLVDGQPVTAVDDPSGTRVHFLAFPGPDDDVPAWGDEPSRGEYLADLARRVDLLTQAAAFLQQKIAGLAWSIDGPERTARKWRDLLSPIWSPTVAAWVGVMVRYDGGGWVQVLRLAPRWAVDEDGNLNERGKAALESGKADNWQFAGLLPLDPLRCTPTGDPAAPVIYNSAHEGPVTLRAAHVLGVVDSPQAALDHPGLGLCAVSRCLDAARLRRELAQYFREAFEDKPKSGIVALGNVHHADWEAIIESHETGVAQKGITYWHGMIVLTNAEATQPISVSTVPFRIAPDGWSQRDSYTECKEIIAAAFGLDPLEFGAMPGQGLGSGQQSTVMATKSKGKLIAFILQSIEREMRRILPPQLEFRFVAQDVEEEKERAELNGVLIGNVVALWGSAAGGIITTAEARQLLVDAEIIPPEFLQADDVTDQENVSDTESEAPEDAAGPTSPAEDEGPLVKAYRDGRVWRKAIQPRTAATRQHKEAPAGRLRGWRQTIQRDRHPHAVVKLTADYEDSLRQVYEDWAAQAAQELAEADEGEREEKLLALLALLALRLRQEGRARLTAAFEAGLRDAAPDAESLAALEAALLRNDHYIDTSLIPDARARMEQDIDVAGFAWSAEQLEAALGALSWRTGLYSGALWAAFGLGAGAWAMAKRGDPPVRRFLDPSADHCPTCPGKEREYANWNEMVALAGIPGDGSDVCNGNCRCGVEAYIDGYWVPIL